MTRQHLGYRKTSGTPLTRTSVNCEKSVPVQKNCKKLGMKVKVMNRTETLRPGERLAGDLAMPCYTRGSNCSMGNKGQPPAEGFTPAQIRVVRCGRPCSDRRDVVTNSPGWNWEPEPRTMRSRRYCPRRARPPFRLPSRAKMMAIRIRISLGNHQHVSGTWDEPTNTNRQQDQKFRLISNLKVCYGR